MKNLPLRFTVLAFTVVGISLAAPSLSVAAGALAIDENQGDQYGWAINYPTQAEADRRAMNECGYGCSIVMRFGNTCAAYAADQARGSSCVWVGRTGTVVHLVAQIGLLGECRNRGGANNHCIVRVWGGGLNRIADTNQNLVIHTPPFYRRGRSERGESRGSRVGGVVCRAPPPTGPERARLTHSGSSPDRFAQACLAIHCCFVYVLVELGVSSSVFPSVALYR